MLESMLAQREDLLTWVLRVFFAPELTLKILLSTYVFLRSFSCTDSALF